jgi:hypothetical protein
VRSRVAGSKFHTADPPILGAGVQNSIARATWLPGFGMMTELVPSSEIATLCVLWESYYSPSVFPHIRRRSFCYELQIDIKAFPVHDAHIQWNNKGYDFFFNLGAGRVT